MSAEITKRGAEPEQSAPKRQKTHLDIPSSNPVGENGISECFQVFSTSLYLSLAPCHIQNPVNGIKSQHLDPMIMTYLPKAKGVVLSYSNIALSHDNQLVDADGNAILVARTADSSPYVFLWVDVDFLVWKPEVNDVLEGLVYMQTASHIGLLIHDTFNASIKYFNIPSDWEFVPSQADEYGDEEAPEREEKGSRFKSFGHWVDGSSAKIEGKLTFSIKTIHTTGRVVSVEGTLVKPGAEKDAQPFYSERRSSVATQKPQNTRKTFSDDDQEEVAVAEILEPAEDEGAVPAYTAASDEEAGEADSDSDSDSS